MCHSCADAKSYCTSILICVPILLCVGGACAAACSASRYLSSSSSSSSSATSASGSSAAAAASASAAPPVGSKPAAPQAKASVSGRMAAEVQGKAAPVLTLGRVRLAPAGAEHEEGREHHLRGPGRKHGTPVSGWQQQLVSRIGVSDHTTASADSTAMVEYSAGTPRPSTSTAACSTSCGHRSSRQSWRGGGSANGPVAGALWGLRAVVNARRWPSSSGRCRRSWRPPLPFRAGLSHPMW